MAETKDVIVSRTFDAPLDKVWALWTDAEMVKQWWGPQYFTAPTVRMDFTVGGEFALCMHGAAGPGMPESDYWNAGTYKEIEPMKRIVQEMTFADADGKPVPASYYHMPGDWPDTQTVTTVFEEVEPGKTKVTVTETGIPAGMGEGAGMGWQQQFDKIVGLLA